MSVRPRFGLSPKFLKEIVGKRALRDIRENTAVNLEFLSE